jgi:hypothetical protein
MFVFVANVESTQGMVLSLAVFLLLNTSLGPRILASAPTLLSSIFPIVAIGALINGWIAPGVLDPVVEWVDRQLRRAAIRFNARVDFGVNAGGGVGGENAGWPPMFGRATGYLARRRKAKAEEAVRRLHSEPYRSAEQLGALPSAELRALATARGGPLAAKREEAVVEKSELAKMLQLKDTCSICLDAWHEGPHNDEPDQRAVFLRCPALFIGPCSLSSVFSIFARPGTHTHAHTHTNKQTNTHTHTHTHTRTHTIKFVRCGHYFHSQCIMQWATSATELSDRPVACPYCNTPLDNGDRD